MNYVISLIEWYVIGPGPLHEETLSELQFQRGVSLTLFECGKGLRLGKMCSYNAAVLAFVFERARSEKPRIVKLMPSWKGQSPKKK